MCMCVLSGCIILSETKKIIRQSGQAIHTAIHKHILPRVSASSGFFKLELKKDKKERCIVISEDMWGPLYDLQ